MPRKKAKYYVRPDGLHETIRRINGKRIPFRGRSDAEVERKMLEYQAKLAQGRTFREVAADWEAEHFEEVTPNTLRAYRPALSGRSSTSAMTWCGRSLRPWSRSSS